MTRFLGPWAGHLTILAFPGGGQFDRCQAREGGGGAGIGQAFDTIFRPLGWAFDDTGLPGGGAV